MLQIQTALQNIYLFLFVLFCWVMKSSESLIRKSHCSLLQVHVSFPWSLHGNHSGIFNLRNTGSLQLFDFTPFFWSHIEINNWLSEVQWLVDGGGSWRGRSLPPSRQQSVWAGQGRGGEDGAIHSSVVREKTWRMKKRHWGEGGEKKKT